MDPGPIEDFFPLGTVKSKEMAEEKETVEGLTLHFSLVKESPELMCRRKSYLGSSILFIRKLLRFGSSRSFDRAGEKGSSSRVGRALTRRPSW